MHAFIFPSDKYLPLRVRISITKRRSGLLQLQIQDQMTWVYFLHAKWKLPCCLASLAILLNMPSLSLASVPCPGVMASAIVCRTCNLAHFPSLHGDGVDHGHDDVDVYAHNYSMLPVCVSAMSWKALVVYQRT